jgi:hypothetical protein
MPSGIHQAEERGCVMSAHGAGFWYCMGVECPVRRQCRRYTEGVELEVTDGVREVFNRKCTSQKAFVKKD